MSGGIDTLNRSTPLVSVVIPTYLAGSVIEECLQSIERQTYENLEILVVDDASRDDTAAVIRSHGLSDSRIKPILLGANRGTLGARKAGVLNSTGDYVMLVDQDDELLPNAISDLLEFALPHSADIYHFPVRVVPENALAAEAARGMTSFLTPLARRIEGGEILITQLLEDGGFDWHVHHKLFRGDFARMCYGQATDDRLILADDIYMCFIMCSQAQSYEALSCDPLYLYHLGRGDTYGGALDLTGFARLAHSEASALRFASEFVDGSQRPLRDDWAERLIDLRDRLIFHTMNEWMDSLPTSEKEEGLTIAIREYGPDPVCGELYRFVRDKAYAFLQEGDASSPVASELEQDVRLFMKFVREAEKTPCFDYSNTRYRRMREIALSHLIDGGLVDGAVDNCEPLRMGGLFRRALRRLKRRSA